MIFFIAIVILTLAWNAFYKHAAWQPASRLHAGSLGPENGTFWRNRVDHPINNDKADTNVYIAELGSKKSASRPFTTY